MGQSEQNRLPNQSLTFIRHWRFEIIVSDCFGQAAGPMLFNDKEVKARIRHPRAERSSTCTVVEHILGLSTPPTTPKLQTSSDFKALESPEKNVSQSSCYEGCLWHAFLWMASTCALNQWTHRKGSICSRPAEGEKKVTGNEASWPVGKKKEQNTTTDLRCLASSPPARILMDE